MPTIVVECQCMNGMVGTLHCRVHNPNASAAFDSDIIPEGWKRLEARTFTRPEDWYFAFGKWCQAAGGKLISETDLYIRKV